MKSKFQSLQAQFINAVKRLEEILAMEESVIVRDSAIQRFEFTTELAWKSMKAYLQEKMGARDLFFPNEIIKSAYQARLIDNDPVWLDMIDTRNKTSHIYSEAMVEDVYKELPKYLPLFKKLADELN